MQHEETIVSRFSLQRWVAFITASGAFLVAIINFVALLTVYDQPALSAATHPTVFWIVLQGVVFALTGLWDSMPARMFQVLIIALGGVLTAFANPRGDLTSAVFVVFAMVLLNDYARQRLTAIVSAAFAIAYLASFAIGIGDLTASITLTVINLIILTSAVILLFGYISYRHNVIQKRHETMLESLVDERTKELREAVHQRDTMLQEIHHRVGNSLQLLASFVSLQHDKAAPAQQQTLKETELRVHAIAGVHATLYSQHQLSHLPLSDYAGELISDMQIAYRDEVEIVSELETHEEAHIDFAISFGIILNELVTNAAKHGGDQHGDTRIRVRLLDTPQSVDLIVQDGGRGFPNKYEPGIGMEVVDQLVQQNGGEIARMNADGGRVLVSFSKDAVRRETAVRVTQEQTA